MGGGTLQSVKLKHISGKLEYTLEIGRKNETSRTEWQIERHSLLKCSPEQVCELGGDVKPTRFKKMTKKDN